MEQLKSLTAILEPDPRFRPIVRINRTTGESRSLTLEDMHAEAAALLMPGFVPETTAGASTAALTLWVYGWFFCPFCTMAYVDAHLLIERAVKDRAQREGLDSESMSLRSLLEAAAARGWYGAEGIRHAQRIRDRQVLRAFFETGRTGFDIEAYLQSLPELIAELRTCFAHPKVLMLLFPSQATIGNRDRTRSGSGAV